MSVLRFTKEPETGKILVKTRREARIEDGYLVGSFIDLYQQGLYRVWTSKGKKARAVSKQHGLKVRQWDQGEAELYVPEALADTALPMFGASKRRVLSPEQKAELSKRAKLAFGHTS